MEPKIHELKTLPEYFRAVFFGDKPFEVRKNDRDFRVGDSLYLREWAPSGVYTGRSLLVLVTYVLDGFVGLVPGYCVMAIEVKQMREDGITYVR